MSWMLFSAGVVSVICIEAVYIIAIKIYNKVMYRRWALKTMNNAIKKWNEIKEMILREGED